LFSVSEVFAGSFVDGCSLDDQGVVDVSAEGEGCLKRGLLRFCGEQAVF